MSLLVIGLSHRTAPVRLLEQTALTEELAVKLLGDVVGSEHVSEAVAVATCNRLEVYAEVSKFHGALAGISELLAQYTTVPRDVLTQHFYVHYDDRAAWHMFTVACGLDSMVVGEPQILGQLRTALALGQQAGTAGPVLNELMQQALRVGKRAHSETALDRAGQSLVTAALDLAVAEGAPAPRRAVVVGAGSMSALAATTILRRYPEAALTVVNRTPERAERLAAAVNGTAAPLSELPTALADADLILSCTGATELVLTAERFSAARAGSERPVTLIDLALPRDLDPAIGRLAGAALIDLELIAEAQKAATAEGPGDDSLEAVKEIVEAELEAYRKLRTASTVAPTVTALRCMAAELVSAELSRFHGRTAGLDERTRAEVEQTVRRVVDKLLHEPTVRVKQLAVADGGVTYAQALRELFNLDPGTAVAVSRAEPTENQ
ncbi:glutamyl-tRNA reductase [Actinospica sp. MGRD01-02]|uniref:Glutamyl-tRNA reductase n=1 Tax=Actinospica acidithermotolerans TaxID=2828514 RepID=A0A941IG88_9ACTN|nr:glutamyl-tRNA reductase [Actinospica acidithermotolerans]MBR7825854.1 glutamyl-tRNA reductase [Actinospica acidithermotolerans]